MTMRHALAAFLLSAAALTGLVPARAQDMAAPPVAPVAEPPRCGGLLCDMGLFTGRRDPSFGAEPECGFFCRITGGGAAADAAAAQRVQMAQQQADAAAAAAVEPPKPHHKAKHRHVAMAKAKAEPAAAPAAPPEPTTK